MKNDTLQKRKETYSEVYQDGYELSALIGPSDVEETADSWDDISDEELRAEIRECLTVANQERQYEGCIRDLAVTMWRNGLPRVSMDDMAFDDPETAVEKGYWPNSMDKWTCEEILFERDIPTDVRQEAWEVVSAAIADKLNPRVEKFASL